MKDRLLEEGAALEAKGKFKQAEELYRRGLPPHMPAWEHGYAEGATIYLKVGILARKRGDYLQSAQDLLDGIMLLDEYDDSRSRLYQDICREFKKTLEKAPVGLRPEIEQQWHLTMDISDLCRKLDSE